MSCKLSASSLTRRSVATLVTLFLLAVLTIGICTDHRQVEEFNTVASNRNTVSVAHRRLLNIAPGPANTPLAENEKTVEPNRIWSDKCSTSDIMISQGPTQPLPSGIPTYTVEITNMCVSGCDISRIHLKCGWFSSARLVNPKVFKRLHFDDCLVNDGKPLVNGRTLSFKYANTYRYPLVVSSITC